MKRYVLPICILVCALGIAAVVYLFGLTGKALAVTVIFLLCPVLVLMQITRIVRQFDKDMAEARRQLKPKRKRLP